MPFVTVPADTWTSIFTTVADTVFQNRGGTTIYLTTEATGGLSLSEGLAVGPNDAIIISPGAAVSASSPRVASSVYYSGV